MFRNQKITPVGQQQEGVYTCSECGEVLFNASTRFDVGSGFPSFWAHVEEGVQLNPLDTYGRHRIQLLCRSCGQHLGHLFDDSRTPTQVRYCINANAVQEQKPKKTIT